MKGMVFMKYKRFVICGVILILVSMSWFVGFVLGNSSGRENSLKSRVYMDVAVIKEIDDGDIVHARQIMKTRVSGAEWWLRQKPIWWVSFKDFWYVNSDEIYSRSVDDVESLLNEKSPQLD